MEEFLEEREDLVVIFFTKVDFEYHDYKALHHKFNTTEPPPNGQYLHGKPPSILQTAQETKPKQDFQCYFDSTQLNLIARHANEVHLFSADVSEEDMRKLFSCQVSKQLKARSNRRVAFFFDMLCSKNLICKQWQSIIAKHKLILSSSTDKPLTTTKLSSATSDAKSTNASIYEAIRKKVQEIADCGKNDSKDTIWQMKTLTVGLIVGWQSSALPSDWAEMPLPLPSVIRNLVMEGDLVMCNDK